MPGMPPIGGRGACVGPGAALLARTRGRAVRDARSYVFVVNGDVVVAGDQPVVPWGVALTVLRKGDAAVRGGGGWGWGWGWASRSACGARRV